RLWLRSGRRAVLACGFALGTGIPSAQNISDSQTKLTSRTELVSIPVVVNDSFGSHVYGIMKEDFTVYEVGGEQPISVFEEVQPSKAAPTPNTDPHDQFTNIRPDDASNRQLTIVLIDMLNTPVPDQVHAKDEVVKYLSDPANAGHPMSLLALNR